MNTQTTTYNALRPMRPGLKLVPSLFPKRWLWQLKVDEERGIFQDGQLFNRHGLPLAFHKAQEFREAVEDAAALFPGHVLDLGLLGFRDSGNFRQLKGRVILFDLPTLRQPCLDRMACIAGSGLPVLKFGLLSEAAASNNRVFCLSTHTAEPEAIYQLSMVLPGTEGIIGRNPEAYYQSGESPDMAKCRWR